LLGLALAAACEAAFVQAPSRGMLRLCKGNACPARTPVKQFVSRQAVPGPVMFLGDFWKKITGQNKEFEKELMELSSDKEFEGLLSRCAEEEKMVVVDFYASWYPQCLVLEPKFQKLGVELADVATFVKVDALLVEYNEGKAGKNAIMKKAGVVQYPTYQVWKQRQLVGEIVGGDMEVQAFEDALRSMVLSWKGRPADPLRVTGLGATAKEYKSKGTFDDGDLGFGKWIGGHGGGGGK